jgi:hypothetical protein
MAKGIPGDNNYYGRVSTNRNKYPTSSLVKAFGKNVDLAVEAVVLRGYAGKSTAVDRAIEFVRIAGRNGLPEDEVTDRTRRIEDLRDLAEENLLRIYLTPLLDRYVDFDRSCLMAWRYEANSLRQDMVTVWLRRYDTRSVQITYRVIDEAVIGAAPAAYLGGEILDDYLAQSSSQTSAWGGGAGATLGNKRSTVPYCTP